MLVNTKYRTQAAEIMDDFTLEGEELRDALDKIAEINKVLGGNKITLEGIKELLKGADKTKIITIADVGCGNGDMLRALSEYGKLHGYTLRLVGIDANPFTINYAKNLSEMYPDIDYLCMDIFSKEFEALEYDIFLCTLTLHHFKNEEILKIMSIFNKNAALGVIVNDLHRSKTSYTLFSIICRVFRLNRMSREDGLVSILRGFKKNELEQFAKQLKIKNSIIQWKWAFRYQWIIKKL